MPSATVVAPWAIVKSLPELASPPKSPEVEGVDVIALSTVELNKKSTSEEVLLWSVARMPH